MNMPERIWITTNSYGVVDVNWRGKGDLRDNVGPVEYRRVVRANTRIDCSNACQTCFECGKIWPFDKDDMFCPRCGALIGVDDE
jgi:hypothetical protein